MLGRLSLIVVMLCLCLVVNAPCQAEPGVVVQANGMLVSPELVAAYRDFAIARQRLTHYRQVTLPQERMALAHDQALLRTQIQVLQRRLVDYQPFLAVGQYSPVRTAAENDFLALQAAEQAAQATRQVSIHRMRFGSQADQLHQYDVLLAALRVRAAHAALGQ